MTLSLSRRIHRDPDFSEFINNSIRLVSFNNFNNFIYCLLNWPNCHYFIINFDHILNPNLTLIHPSTIIDHNAVV